MVGVSEDGDFEKRVQEMKTWMGRWDRSWKVVRSHPFFSG